MKAILMLKEMPKSCKNCPFMFESDDGQWCGYERTGKNELHMRVHYYVGDRTKPSWCSLRPFELGKELRKFRNTINDKKTLIGFNMAVAICNKYLGEKE